MGVAPDGDHPLDGAEYEESPLYGPFPPGEVAGIDLGEVHMAVSHDGRVLRSKVRYRNKLQAQLNSRIEGRMKRGSKRRKRVIRSKKKQLKKIEHQIEDIEHQQTTRLITTLQQDGVRTLVIGDGRDIRQGNDVGHLANQKIHQWSHGSVRFKLTYKAERLAMAVALQEESYTSRTCPRCRHVREPGEGARLSLPEVRLHLPSGRRGWHQHPAKVSELRPSSWRSKRSGERGMSRPTTYEINSTYFSCIDAPNKAYWLGALAADGCVDWHRNKWVSQFIVAEKDQEWLTSFKTELGSTHPIRVRPGGFGTPCSRFVVTNQILCRSLLALGFKDGDILERVPEPLWCHFIRGLFDGDGCIRLDRGWPRCTGYVPQTFVWKLVSQSDILLKSIQQAFHTYCDITPSKLHALNNAWYFHVRGNRQIERIARYLYPDGVYAFLARKRERFNE